MFAPLGRFVSWLAPHITGALMFVIKLFAALIALVSRLGGRLASWLARAGEGSGDRHGAGLSSGT